MFAKDSIMNETENVTSALEVVQLQAQRLLKLEKQKDYLKAEEERIGNEIERVETNQQYAEKELNRACVSASEAWCCDFTTKLVAKLPREIRDLVYNDFFQDMDCHMLSIDHLAKFRLDDQWSGWRNEPPVMAGPCPPYWAYPYCVHPTFATEVTEVFYRLVNFRVTEPSLLEDALMGDWLCTSVRPADQIRRFDVELHCGSNDRKHDKASLAEIVKPIANLRCIKQLKGLRVRLVLDCDCRASEVNKFEESLAPTIHMLKSNGVHVTWHEFDPYGGEPDKLTVPSRDFSCTLAELKAGIQDNTVFNAFGY